MGVHFDTRTTLMVTETTLMAIAFFQNFYTALDAIGLAVAPHTGSLCLDVFVHRLAKG